jgi:hypothetical protein
MICSSKLAISGDTPVCYDCGHNYGSELKEHIWYQPGTCAVCQSAEQLCATAKDFKYLPGLPAEIAAKILKEELFGDRHETRPPDHP